MPEPNPTTKPVPKTYRLLLVAVCVPSILVLAACEDPSSVGLDLVGADNTQPTVTVVRPGDMSNEEVRDFTGTSSVIPRALAGQVDDPLLGTTSATGYVDFIAPSAIPEGFRDGQVTEASLQLVLDYVYGDTTAPVTLALYDVLEAWDATTFLADTTLAAAPDPITEFEVHARDSLITVALPDAWISENDARLRATTFNDDFHGFKLAWRSGNTVLGFRSSGFRLVATSGGTSVSFLAGKTGTGIARSGLPDVGPNRLLMQDGSGLNVQVRFDLRADGVADHAVHRARLVFPVDTLALQSETAGFVRPTPGEVSLFAITPDDLIQEIARASMDDAGRLVFENADIRSILQRLTLGEDLIDRFRLGFPVENNTIDALLLYGPMDSTESPELILTLSPPDN